MRMSSLSRDSVAVPGGILTPRATPSPVPEPERKRAKLWDVEYEVETILGYNREELTGKMWYLVKWKNWPKTSKTWEPIENLTNCHAQLMKHFESRKPPPAEMKQMEEEIEQSLQNCPWYLILEDKSLQRFDIDDFSESHFDVQFIFTRGFEKTEARTRREFDIIVRCLIGMARHRDEGLFYRGQTYLAALKLCDRRRRQLETLSQWIASVNSVETCHLELENMQDLDVFPEELEYVAKMKLGEGVVVPDDPCLWCECMPRCSASQQQCCGPQSNSTAAYNQFRRVRVPEQTPIYECNAKCHCNADCTNRVVQHGIKVELCIFKTPNCGWSVKARHKILKGTFVCEYIGELIRDEVANTRDIHYVKKNLSYVFDLDFNMDELNVYCVDATNVGNIARFINHSCDPNLIVYPVWIDCLDPNIPRLAFFAKRTINAGEEIHFDYENIDPDEDKSEGQEDGDDSRSPTHKKLRMLSKVRCECRAENCRGWVFGNK